MTLKGAPFDGKRFLNLEPVRIKTLRDVFKWQLKNQRQAWPRWIESSAQAVIPVQIAKGQAHVTFVNHATVLVQTSEFNFLTDPVWSKRVSPFSWAGPARVREPGIQFDRLPRIDAVLVSHNHYDHLDIETLKRLDTQFSPLFYVALGDAKILRQAGIRQVQEMNWWTCHTDRSAQITFLPAQHWSGRWTYDRCRSLWGSFGIEIEGAKIYFAGDTGWSPHFKMIQENWGSPDLALFPIGAYEPRWFMKDFHMNPEDAVQAFLDLRARFAMAIHFGTWQLTDEGIDQPFEDLGKALAKHQISSKKFFTLPQGGGWDLGPMPRIPNSFI